ncbi:AAA family ATPase [Tenacibaculum sp. TC6]|uniref:AAA family ATPase n=1 Tax=Tenacibaculum sp. TC6 TaxID=3423223 RepID=UPI003D3648CD
MTSYDITTSPNIISEPLNQLHLSSENQEKINHILDEFKYLNVLSQYGLHTTHKLLFFGDSGCGKTATAKAVAKELDKKIITLDLSEFVSSRLGETAKNVNTIFKKAAKENAVLFLDEFDSVGKLRDYDTKDSGEMKRLVNTLIQLIDYLPNNVLLICATNHMHAIDKALLRRFETTMEFIVPNDKELDVYYCSLLERFPEKFHNIQKKYAISYAEAKDLVFNQVKKQIINQEKAKEKLTHEQLNN